MQEQSKKEEADMEQQGVIEALTVEENLEQEDRRRIGELIYFIDIHDRNKVIALGREQQSKIGKFYDTMLQDIVTDKIGEAEKLLQEVVTIISNYGMEAEEKNNLFSFFRKQKNKLETIKSKYQFVIEKIDNLSTKLLQCDQELKKLSYDFEEMYQINLEQYKFLTLLILAGEKVLEEEKTNAESQKAIQSAQDMLKAQRLSDVMEDTARFERRLYDLKISRTIAIQQAPQIRLIQKNADILAESIRSTIANSVPLWKSQMAMCLGMQSIQKGMNAVNSVKDTTNALLLANSEMNKKLTIETAKAVERGVVDIETMNQVNQNLIQALEESSKIAKQAIEDRKKGSEKLKENEATLKTAILQIANKGE